MADTKIDRCPGTGGGATNKRRHRIVLFEELVQIVSPYCFLDFFPFDRDVRCTGVAPIMKENAVARRGYFRRQRLELGIASPSAGYQNGRRAIIPDNFEINI